MTKGKSTDNNNINSTDKNGYTALMKAVLSGNIEIAATLIQKGADINLVSEKTSYSPLIFASSLYKTDMILFLIKCGGNVNQKIINEGRDNHDQTALQLVSDQINKKQKTASLYPQIKLLPRKFLLFTPALQ